MSMTLSFGDFKEALYAESDSVKLCFTFSKVTADRDFLCHNLSFGVVVSYLSQFINSSTLSFCSLSRKDLEQTIDFIINELLENTIKYGDDNKPEIFVEIHVCADEVLITCTNCIDEKNYQLFKSYVSKLTSGNPQEIYSRQLEMSLNDNRLSRLGFLSIINDYQAKIGWRFDSSQTSDENKVIISVSVPAAL